MPKFFVDIRNIQSDKILITGEDVNHIKKVLRLRTGDNIIVSDGCGLDYQAVVEQFESERVIAGIISSEKNSTEPPIDITLFQGVPKSDKMDMIIQKSVELGVKNIVPVITDRTVVKIENKKDAGNKVTRWQRIALEAAKQCNRGKVPSIESPISFEKALERLKEYDICLIPYENESNNKLRDFLKDKGTKKAAVIIGPEGGFSEKEIEKSVKAGAVPVTLGPRILRTETAGLVVLSIIMYTLGDVG